MIRAPLKKVQTLVCLAESGSFRGAAERLHISQPAVSAHIRDLEQLFGVALVRRTTRRVELTPEGKAFAARAGRAVAELDLAVRDLRDLSDSHRGQVVVACIPPVMSSAIPRLVQTLDRRFPGVEVRLLDVLSSQIDALVMRGEADFGIGPRLAMTTVSFERLVRDDFVAAVPRRHPLAERREIDLVELADYPIIANERAANARQIVDHAFERLGRPIRPRFELVHYFSVGRFVEAGLGVTVLPRMVFPSLASSRIVPLNIRTPHLYRDIGLIRRKEYRPSPAASAFISVLRRQFAKRTEA